MQQLSVQQMYRAATAPGSGYLFPKVCSLQLRSLDMQYLPKCMLEAIQLLLQGLIACHHQRLLHAVLTTYSVHRRELAWDNTNCSASAKLLYSDNNSKDRLKAWRR